MKNYDKSEIRVIRSIIAAFVFLIGYIMVMLIIIYVSSRNLQNDVEEMYIEYGYEQGRRHAIDSLKNVSYENHTQK